MSVVADFEFKRGIDLVVVAAGLIAFDQHGARARSTTISERVKIEAGSSPGMTNTRCSGRSTIAPGGTADHHAIAHEGGVERDRDVVGWHSLPRWAVTSGIALGKGSDIGRMVRPFSSSGEIGHFRHENAVDKYEPPAIHVADQIAPHPWRAPWSWHRARRPAAWPRASARAGRCISIPRRAGAAGRAPRIARTPPRAGRHRPLARKRLPSHARKFGEPLLGRRFNLAESRRSAVTPALPDIARSPWPRVQAQVPCRRSSRCGRARSRARRPARCSSGAADNA